MTDDGAESREDASRRGFLRWFLGTSVGAMFVSILYPVARYISPPEIPEAQTRSVVAGTTAELKPNEAKVFRFGNSPGLLVRLEDGSYRAFQATCTHLNCTVQYRGDLKQIWCACHNGLFDLNGKNISGPPPSPLEAFKVNIISDEIVVQKS